MAETMTGWVPLPWLSEPPNCSKPVPVSWVAVTRNSWPDTEMLDAIAPCAVSATRIPATTPAGTAAIANRRHLILPFAWGLAARGASCRPVLLFPTDMAFPFGAPWCTCPRRDRDAGTDDGLTGCE